MNLLKVLLEMVQHQLILFKMGLFMELNSNTKKIYRITRNPIGLEEKIKAKFDLNKTAIINFFEIPAK